MLYNLSAYLASDLRDKVSVYTKSPLTYPDIPEAKMGGGGDGYRAVAYFVNVSAQSGKLNSYLTIFIVVSP
jgi:hypothetical protein